MAETSANASLSAPTGPAGAPTSELPLTSEPKTAPVFKPVWDLPWPAELLGCIQTTEGDWKARNMAKPSFPDDLAATRAFLATVPSKSQNSYLAELERLLYWVYYIHKKPISSFVLDDRLAFENFLRDPQPTEFWCIDHPIGNTTRYSPAWRPFQMRAVPAAGVDPERRRLLAPGDDVKWIDPASGRARDNPGLSEPSIARATRIICQFMGWLRRSGYLRRDPWWISNRSRNWPKGFARPQEKHRLKRLPLAPMRADDWRYVVRALDETKEVTGAAARRWLRLRCLMYWTFYVNPTPMALSEAMDSDISWFTDGDSTVGIWRTIIRRHDGIQPLWLPLNEVMAKSYMEWKAACGYHSVNALRLSSLPVFQRLTDPPDGKLTRHQIHNLQKRMLKAGAAYARTVANDPDASDRLQRAVDSRLRHLVPTLEGRIQRAREYTAEVGRFTLGHANAYLFADSPWPKEPIKFEDCLTLP